MRSQAHSTEVTYPPCPCRREVAVPAARAGAWLTFASTGAAKETATNGEVRGPSSVTCPVSTERSWLWPSPRALTLIAGAIFATGCQQVLVRASSVGGDAHERTIAPPLRTMMVSASISLGEARLKRRDEARVSWRSTTVSWSGPYSRHHRPQCRPGSMLTKTTRPNALQTQLIARISRALCRRARGPWRR